MAILIQKLTNIVNIIDTAKPAGKTIIMALAVDCVAKPQIKTPNPDQVDILDADGMPTYTITFTPTLEVQDFGGAPAVFVGTLDDLVNKLNDEYFNNAVTAAGGGGGGGDASAANQLTQITEIQKLTGANAPSQQEITNPAAVVISAFKKLSFVCTGAITVTIDGNAIIYPYNLGGAANVYGATFEADDITTNAATFNGTGTVLITTKQ
jgi:hypothetical protein